MACLANVNVAFIVYCCGRYINFTPVLICLRKCCFCSNEGSFKFIILDHTVIFKVYYFSLGKTIAIFYGSQTGTAEEFSQRLSKDSQRYKLKAVVYDPEECEMDELNQMVTEIPKSLAVFVVATYGEGDPTDNAIAFYDWLKEGPELTGLNYAVFSLGNKTYEHYQGFGRYVDKRLEELGGNRVCQIGEGDDNENIEEDFVAWRELFWDNVCDFYGISKDKRSLSISVSRDYQLQVMRCSFLMGGS